MAAEDIKFDFDLRSTVNLPYSEYHCTKAGHQDPPCIDCCKRFYKLYDIGKNKVCRFELSYKSKKRIVQKWVEAYESFHIRNNVSEIYQKHLQEDGKINTNIMMYNTLESITCQNVPFRCKYNKNPLKLIRRRVLTRPVIYWLCKNDIRRIAENYGTCPRNATKAELRMTAAKGQSGILRIVRHWPEDYTYKKHVYRYVFMDIALYARQLPIGIYMDGIAVYDSIESLRFDYKEII